MKILLFNKMIKLRVRSVTHSIFLWLCSTLFVDICEVLIKWCLDFIILLCAWSKLNRNQTPNSVSVFVVFNFFHVGFRPDAVQTIEP